jgi:hypothetical protein
MFKKQLYHDVLSSREARDKKAYLAKLESDVKKKIALGDFE